jgi:hypothetical protein
LLGQPVVVAHIIRDIDPQSGTSSSPIGCGGDAARA